MRRQLLALFRLLLNQPEEKPFAILVCGLNRKLFVCCAMRETPLRRGYNSHCLPCRMRILYAQILFVFCVATYNQRQQLTPHLSPNNILRRNQTQQRSYQTLRLRVFLALALATPHIRAENRFYALLRSGPFLPSFAYTFSV